MALLVTGLLVWHGTSAAFSTSTQNSGNAYGTGTVSITDDDGGTAPFTASNLQRGATGTRCVQVTYGGSLTGAVRLYLSASSGTLRSSLTVTVEEGTGGSFAGCGGFTPTSTLYSGTLQAFATAASSWSSGVSAWTPTGPGQSRTYRVTYTLSPSAPPSAQNSTAAATLTWEARNT